MNEHEAPTTAHTGFFPVVSGETIDMRHCGAGAVLARGDVSLTQGGAQMILAGGDLTVEQGGGRTLASRGNLSIHDGGAFLAGGSTVSVNDGVVGVAIGAKLDLTNSKVLLGPAQTIAMGVAFGVTAAVAHRILRRPGA